jgi:hypothetical protein
MSEKSAIATASSHCKGALQVNYVRPVQAQH